MRKLSLWIISLLTVFAFPLMLIHSQEPTTEPPPMPTPVQYRLPYPGMLPDHPLYKVKVLRDKIMLVLTQDPEKKVQYHLTLANKQLLMSKLLVDKGNIPLAKETALKGENQMTLMTFVFKNASRMPTPAFLNEVKLATSKHQELLKEIIGKVSKDNAETFSTVLEFSQRNADQLQYLATDQ